MKNSILFPYFSYISAFIMGWKHKNDNEKIEACSSISISLEGLIQYLEKQSSATACNQLYTIKKAFNDAKIDEQTQFELIQKAYNQSINCNMCAICKECSQKFLSLCAFEMFDLDSEYISKNIKVDFNNSINSLSLNDKNSFKLIDSDIISLVHDNRDSILKQYINKIDKERSLSKKQNYLLSLKGMSSSSPWLYNSTTNKKFNGGGFFIKWNNHGIAIDPGYNFIDNLHNNDLSIQDIDYVIVTHNHIDHNHDIRIIDDLNKNIWKNKKHVINWYLDSSTYEFSKVFLEDFSSTDNKACNIIEYEKLKLKPITLDLIFCRLTFFPTEHIMIDKSTYSKDSFGIKIEFCSDDKRIQTTLSYTSDTHYNDNLVEYLENSDIVIANISGIYETDIKRIELKKKHLGYWGCINILENMKKKPELFLLSEFWSGINDIRFPISRYIQNEICKQFPTIKTKVIPSDIGLCIELDSKKIKCSNCNKYSNSIRIIKPKNDFDDIQYICNDCIV